MTGDDDLDTAGGGEDVDSCVGVLGVVVDLGIFFEPGVCIFVSLTT